MNIGSFEAEFNESHLLTIVIRPKNLNSICYVDSADQQIVMKICENEFFQNPLVLLGAFLYTRIPWS